MAELDEDERRILADAESREKGTAVEPEQPQDAQKPKAADKPRRQEKQPDITAAESARELADRAQPPTQYDDVDHEWNDLPAQMRHDAAGSPL